MLRFYSFANLLQLICFSTFAYTSRVTQNASNVTPTTAVQDRGEENGIVNSDTLQDTTPSLASHNADIATPNTNTNATGTKTSVLPDTSMTTVTDGASKLSTNFSTKGSAGTTASVKSPTTTTELLKSEDTPTNTTASVTSNSTNPSECAIRVGFLWWKKITIPVKHAHFNARKCELQYCSPNLKVEPFTCKNLLALIVPPASTEDLINEWKLDCARHQCIPAV